MNKRNDCACCGNDRFNTIFDFGEIPLAGSFLLEKDRHNIDSYPLAIIMCPRCKLVQTDTLIEPKVLFKDYRYISSIGMQKHFNEYADWLVTKEKIQIRHNALESARMIINRRLHRVFGNNYKFKLRVYPHHILRENKMLTGAGADRMQSGMQKSFGKPVGLAAQVKINQPLFTVYVDEKDLNAAREIMKKGFSRLPCKCKVI